MLNSIYILHSTTTAILHHPKKIPIYAPQSLTLLQLTTVPVHYDSTKAHRRNNSLPLEVPSLNPSRYRRYYPILPRYDHTQLPSNLFKHLVLYTSPHRRLLYFYPLHLPIHLKNKTNKVRITTSPNPRLHPPHPISLHHKRD